MVIGVIYTFTVLVHEYFCCCFFSSSEGCRRVSILILINLFFLCSCHFRSGLQFSMVGSSVLFHLERKIRDSSVSFYIYLKLNS